MPSSRPLTRHPRCNFAATLLVSLCLVGCATTPASTPRPSASRTVLKPATDIEGQPFGQTVSPRTLPLIPVVREGRYTLVELSPSAGQQDLMQQIVDVSMPPTLTASVGDAVRYVVLRSGFTLCDRPEIRILYTLPLPGADFHLGPLTLESALQILAGPGWKLEVDELTRRICFVPVSPPTPAGRPSHAGPESGQADASRTMATAPEQRP